MTTLAPARERPVLWQLQISHYNEKVRWALDYKRIPHTRRSMMPGTHRLITRWLAGTVHSPVLVVGGGRSPPAGAGGGGRAQRRLERDPAGNRGALAGPAADSGRPGGTSARP